MNTNNTKAPAATEAPGDCEGCNGRGMVGGLRQDGYHSEECPFCKGSGRQAAAVGASVQPSDWLLIEGAPKDGRTLLLGYFNSAGKWRTLRGQWFSQQAIDEEWEEPDIAEAGWYETSVENDTPPNCWWTEPTHYQLLPKEPGASVQPVPETAADQMLGRYADQADEIKALLDTHAPYTTGNIRARVAQLLLVQPVLASLSDEQIIDAIRLVPMYSREEALARGRAVLALASSTPTTGDAS